MKWISLAVVGVVLLVAGVALITSGIGPETGQLLGVAGVGLILVAVLVLAIAPRWALLGAKGRAVLFGAGLLGRILKAVAILVVAIVAVVYLMA